MDVKVKSINFTADEKLVLFCEKKTEKLGKFYDGVIGVEVILRVDAPATNDNKLAEIIMKVPGKDSLFAKKHASSFEVAVDDAVEAVRRQLKKVKEKSI